LENELEKAMRELVLKSAGAVGALAMIVTAAACSRATDEDLELADAKGTASVQQARVSDAEQRAAEAEARARAAEAKIECERERQEASNRGAVVGGVTGAVVGSQVAGDGAKSEGGVLGGIAGVLAGRQIAKKDHRC
jgi:uncharacterized protein YcfJ